MPGIIPQAESAGASEIAPRPSPTDLSRVRRVIPRRVNVVPIVFSSIETSVRCTAL
jgi:hypothetical protein